MTDDRVWVREDGTEAVACSRGDGLGLAMLKREGIDAVVLSTEANPIVTARCEKLGIHCRQGLADKAAALRVLAAERTVELSQVVYVGNDVNDLECLRIVGCGVATADAHPDVREAADWVLGGIGGRGAVRELCNQIISAVRAEGGDHGQGR
jgi:N-acylneuraminate cytidylyltransferase